MSQGYAVFGTTLNLTAGVMTMSRGIKPARCLLRRVSSDLTTWTTATLYLTYGATTISMPNCAVVEVKNRHWNGRDGWRQDMVICDRRWMWRYPRIDGVYNERATNNTRQSWTSQSIKALMELCLTALGESGYDTTAVPDNVFPPVVWNRARADLELQWLCDLVGMVVCYQVTTNTVAIKKLNDTSGAAMPALGSPLTPAQRYKPSVTPATLRVQGDPTVIQSKLTLEAVGLETDGSIERIADLSYKPSTGWGAQWYNHFADVAITERDLAFQSVYRWFRPSYGWDGDGVTISNYRQLELLPWMVETEIDADYTVYRRLPPVVVGSFWPQCDLATSTPITTAYPGEFKVRPELGIVEFEYPVINIEDGHVVDPVLYIYVAYRVRKVDCSGYSVYTRDKAVSSGMSGTRVLPHPELTKCKIIDVWYEKYDDFTYDNLSDLDGEAEAYLEMVEATYDFTYADERIYNGLLAQDLDGAIAQVRWRWGDHRPAMTQIGRFTEFDIHTQHHQQKRAMERLAQMAERQSL